MVDTIKDGIAGYTITVIMDNGIPANGFIPYSSLGNVANGAIDSGNGIKISGVFVSGSYGVATTGTRGDLKTDQYYNLRAAPVLTGGVGADGQANTSCGYWPGASTGGSGQNLFAAIYPHTYNGTNWDRTRKVNAANRLLSSAATTNAVSVKVTAGDVHKITGNNTVASKRYLKLYNKASAPTVGTDTPVLTFVLAASAPFDINLSGHYFSTGIAYAITGAAADADATAIGAGDIECMNLTYA